MRATSAILSAARAGRISSTVTRALRQSERAETAGLGSVPHACRRGPARHVLCSRPAGAGPRRFRVARPNGRRRPPLHESIAETALRAAVGLAVDKDRASPLASSDARKSRFGRERDERPGFPLAFRIAPTAGPRGHPCRHRLRDHEWKRLGPRWAHEDAGRRAIPAPSPALARSKESHTLVEPAPNDLAPQCRLLGVVLCHAAR
jgi:hypothetical protein